jgi:serine/threonine protein kinase
VESNLNREESLFAAAVELETAEERERFLSQACQDAPALLARLRRLLEADAGSERALAECLSSAASEPFEAESEGGLERPGSGLSADDLQSVRIAKYKLLQRLGEGGCGVVYLAQQEHPVRRRVAVKVIKLGMDTRSVIARFEAERQALAIMDHPGIAKVLDAGATESGRPYFVMEWVRGVRITEYCDQHQLSIPQRLELFIQVCNAIQHAHQKGIVHRDIKPSNVLVTLPDERPMPKVIDFGIAKATEGRLTDSTLFTAREQFVGTPAYMSPEQAEGSGMDIDTRSDIYSLGVLLYELLTGKTPFDSRELARAGLEKMRRTLCEDEPHRPSTRLNTFHGEELTKAAQCRHVEASRLQSLLHGDLDWIAMRALEKDRSRRYATANSLAADVRHFLNNEPVSARPPSRLYRLRKLIRRNKVVFAAGAVVAAALFCGLGASTWFFFKEREARRLAVASERQQVQLRREAEARERLTQATLRIRENNFSDADELVKDFGAGTLVPESAAVFRSLGEWHVAHERWGRAAERFSPLFRLNPSEGWDEASLDVLRYAGVLVETGEAEALRRLGREAAQRFAKTRRLTVAERILKVNLLLEDDALESEALKGFADMVLPPGPVGIRLQPLTDPGTRIGAADERQGAASLTFQGINTGMPLSLTNDGDCLALSAAGTNIFGQQDSFGYACLLVTNDFDYRLRVRSVLDVDVERGEKLHFSRAGLMVRDSLSDSSSHQLTVAVNSGNTFQNIHRTTRGGGTSDNNSLWPAFGSNSWVRLQRVGSLFYTYSSADGIEWTQLHQIDSGSLPDGPFANPIYIGIAVCAKNAAMNTVAVVSDFGPTPTVPVNRTVCLALLEYRRRHFEKAIEWCRRCIGAYPGYQAARVASAHIIQAMAELQLGDYGRFLEESRLGGDMVNSGVANGMVEGDAAHGYWYDWVFCRQLLRECSALEVRLKR